LGEKEGSGWLIGARILRRYGTLSRSDFHVVALAGHAARRRAITYDCFSKNQTLQGGHRARRLRSGAVTLSYLPSNVPATIARCDHGPY
jgi:hypothetical protein